MEIIGIDLGTTNSLVTIWRNNNYEIIPDLNGNKSIPSIVSFTKASRYIGLEAKNMMILNSENTVYEIKRLLGRKYTDVENDKFYLSYDIVDVDNNIRVNINDKLYSPEEISSIILMELKSMAQAYLKKNITKAVITVPAYFNDSQRQATKDAATIAGLDCVRIINEPTAAALAYGLQETSKGKDINIIIYDLGGGTLDVSLLNINDGIFQVLASTGNTHLGGTDFDNRIIGYCIKEFKLKNNIKDLENLNPLPFQQLRKAVENSKKLLSTLDKVIINVKDFYENITLNIIITKEEFENICQDLFIMALKPLEDVLHSADMTVDDIDDIILVGGATRMSTIRNNIKLYFKNKEPNISINPDNVVSIGAAIQGYILSNKDSPFSKNITLLDIIPLSLGIETHSNLMNVIIPRNSIIPIKKEKKFTTDTDFMTQVDIKIYEGERTITTDNNLLGTFTLQNIESAYRGVPQINIIFNVDINGIINVVAEDIINKNSTSIIIQNNKNRLTSDEINKLIEEAIQMEIVDNIERKKRELVYKIQDLCFNVKFNVCDENKEEITKDIDNILENISASDISELKNIKQLVKKKYGLLIFKKSNNDVKCDSDVIGESLYNDTINIDADDEIIELRENLVEMCNNILEILNDRKDSTETLKNYIDDTILWIYVKENIKKEDYVERLVTLNNLYDAYNKEYEDATIVNNNSELYIKKNNLEQLCYSVLSIIMSNNYSLYEEDIINIKNIITTTLDFLTEVNYAIYKGSDSENYTKMIDDNELLIHNECNKLYNNIVNQK